MKKTLLFFLLTFFLYSHSFADPQRVTLDWSSDSNGIQARLFKVLLKYVHNKPTLPEGVRLQGNSSQIILRDTSNTMICEFKLEQETSSFRVTFILSDSKLETDNARATEWKSDQRGTIEKVLYEAFRQFEKKDPRIIQSEGQDLFIEDGKSAVKCEIITTDIQAKALQLRLKIIKNPADTPSEIPHIPDTIIQTPSEISEILLNPDIRKVLFDALQEEEAQRERAGKGRGFRPVLERVIEIMETPKTKLINLIFSDYLESKQQTKKTFVRLQIRGTISASGDLFIKQHPVVSTFESSAAIPPELSGRGGVTHINFDKGLSIVLLDIHLDHFLARHERETGHPFATRPLTIKKVHKYWQAGVIKKLKHAMRDPKKDHGRRIKPPLQTKLKSVYIVQFGIRGSKNITEKLTFFLGYKLSDTSKYRRILYVMAGLPPSEYEDILSMKDLGANEMEEETHRSPTRRASAARVTTRSHNQGELLQIAEKLHENVTDAVNKKSKQNPLSIELARSVLTRFIVDYTQTHGDLATSSEGEVHVELRNLLRDAFKAVNTEITEAFLRILKEDATTELLQAFTKGKIENTIFIQQLARSIGKHVRRGK